MESKKEMERRIRIFRTQMADTLQEMIYEGELSPEMKLYQVIRALKLKSKPEEKACTE